MAYNIYFVKLLDEHQFHEFTHEAGGTYYTYGYPSDHVIAKSHSAAKWAFVQSLKRDGWLIEITDRASVRIEEKGFATEADAAARIDRDYMEACELETDDELIAAKNAGNLYLRYWEPEQAVRS